MMNEVTQKNCPMKGTAKRKSGPQELSTVEQSFECINHVDSSIKTKTNINGLVNGVTDEKLTVKKRNRKKEKNLVQNSGGSRNLKNNERKTNLITEENSTDKPIIDSSERVKNNRKNKKSTKCNKLNSSEEHSQVSPRTNKVSETNSSNNNEKRNESILNSDYTLPNDKETVPKNSSQNIKKDRNEQNKQFNKNNSNPNIDIDDCDITNKTPISGPSVDKPSCSKSDKIVEIIDQINVMEKLYINQEIITESPSEDKRSTEGLLQPENVEDLPSISYIQYESELQMPMIMKIIQKDLSEPYSIYTYRYFIHNWPNLCFLAMCEELCVGAIVCKLDVHRKETRRGYIAMLAVDKNHRNRGIGSTLVRRAIQEMIAGGADEVVLETEITNKPALRLYEVLGFVRDKRLFRYYLNGVDALRLKLWLR